MKNSLPILCVYKDKKANIFTAPMLFQNEDCALRHFENLSNSNPNICDFDLYVIGSYSDKFGDIHLLNEGNKYLLKSGDEFSTKVDILENYKKIILHLQDEIKILKEKGVANEE